MGRDTSPEAQQHDAARAMAEAALRFDGLPAGTEGPMSPRGEADLEHVLDSLGVTKRGQKIRKTFGRRNAAGVRH